MSLPGIDDLSLLEAPVGGPIATVDAVRESDETRLRAVVVTAELDSATIGRIRAECAHLEAILTGVDPEVVLPLLDHGVDDRGRPYLLTARPGPDLSEVGPLPVPTLVAAAKAAADGLKALAANDIIGSPPTLLLAREPATITMCPPLPPALAELQAAQGDGTGHEPPEVLRGGDWTTDGQVYALASQFWTFLCGQPPFPAALTRLVSQEPPPMTRRDVPHEVVAVLQKALSSEPASRHRDPAELATALRDAAARPLGSLYLLDAQIGQGACGQVWAGRRRSGGDPIAVKLLHPELVAHGDQLGRFVREYHVLHGLRHQHLVRVDEFFGEGGVYAIIMDLVRGENLRQFAESRGLSLAESASLLAQTASGLAAVHEAGLVHRDVKPDNVLVEQRDGRPCALLSDFGIARPLQGSDDTQVMGTPSYLAPELVLGRAPSPAADVYALGVTAFELLAGHKPFYGKDNDSLLFAHVDQPPQRPEGLPDRAWDLISACLEKDPQARPGAAAVAAGFARLADPDPLRYTDSSTESSTLLAMRPASRRPEPTTRRRRRWLLPAVIAVVLAGSGLGVFLASRDKPPQTPVVTAPIQYPVASTVTLDGTMATVSWRSDAGGLPGFKGYLVYDVNGDRLRELTPSMLGADITSYQVEVRAGRKVCFYVIAVGVTVSPPPQLPPVPCVNAPTAKPSNM